jgi:hypothetical protein
MYCDNKATILIAHNLILQVDKHFIKEKIDSGQICMSYVPTTKQIADVFTKGLPQKQFKALTVKLALEDIFRLA